MNCITKLFLFYFCITKNEKKYKEKGQMLYKCNTKYPFLIIRPFVPKYKILKIN